MKLATGEVFSIKHKRSECYGVGRKFRKPYAENTTKVQSGT